MDKTDTIDRNEMSIINSLKYFYRVGEYYPVPAHHWKECILCSPTLVSPDRTERMAFIVEHITKQYLSMPKKMIYEMKQQILDTREQCPYKKATVAYLYKQTETLVRQYEAGKPGIRNAVADHIELVWHYVIGRILAQHAPFLRKQPTGYFTETEIETTQQKSEERVYKALDMFKANQPLTDTYPGIASESTTIEFMGCVKKTTFHERPIRLTLTAFEVNALESTGRKEHNQHNINDPGQKKIIEEFLTHLSMPMNITEEERGTISPAVFLRTTPFGENFMEMNKKMFKERYGREMRGNDPVFFDPSSDVPKAFTAEKIERMMNGFCTKIGMCPGILHLILSENSDEPAVEEEKGIREIINWYHIGSDFREDPGYITYAIATAPVLEELRIEPTAAALLQNFGLTITYDSEDIDQQTKQRLSQSPEFVGIHQDQDEYTVTYLFKNRDNPEAPSPDTRHITPDIFRNALTEQEEEGQ